MPAAASRWKSASPAAEPIWQANQPSRSVSDRSKPGATFGPQFMEWQKQVAAARRQLTATVKSRSRRAL